jgi:hypothetical protein
MQHLKNGLLAGAVFLGTFILFLGVLAGGWTPGKARPFTHMHCPECALEITYHPALEGKPCPQCAGGGSRMISTVGPKTGSTTPDAGGMSSPGNIFAAFVLALAATTSFFYARALWHGSRSQAAQKARNQVRVCPCPICSRKIGYPAREVGKTGFCSRCKTAFVFPDGVPADAD